MPLERKSLVKGEKLILLRNLADSRGGKCLSDKYIGMRFKYEWKCSCGHVWQASAANIKKGSWCPFCSKRTRLGIEKMHEIARSFGGECISDTYVNRSTKIVWKCSCGHIFEKTPAHLLERGQWCNRCSKRPLITIDDVKKIAKNKGGKCLSKVYKNKDTKLLFECKNGHRWHATPHSVKRSTWCPHCSGNARFTIDKMQEIAAERGGVCLSKKYKNNQTNLLWRCAYGHEWQAMPATILSGGWCTECSAGLGERIARAIFEQLFNEKFPKAYPRFLVNGRGNRMELDGYSETLKIAFEHHGGQHYSTKTHYIKDEESLKRRQEDDAEKERLCEVNGIKLVIVPEIPRLMSVAEAKNHIIYECEKKNIWLHADSKKMEINLKAAYTIPRFMMMYEKVKQICYEKYGACLTENYINEKMKLEFQCGYGHKWFSRADKIVQGRWCPKCARNERLTIEIIHALALSKNGKCLSSEYVNGKTKVKWECQYGHQWEAVPSSVIQGKWCPDCGGTKKKDIEFFVALASSRGGKCLSDTYVNGRYKLKWQCNKGHEWFAQASSVTQGKWCPICGGTKKKTIKDMKDLALKKGGKCLSSEYVNKSTKLRWECKNGHQWNAVPNSIVQGLWCPVCSKKQRLTIEEMNEIAKSRGGKCLSAVYINSVTPLLWECEQGHRWQASPSYVKHQGVWCKICNKGYQ